MYLTNLCGNEEWDLLLFCSALPSTIYACRRRRWSLNLLQNESGRRPRRAGRAEASPGHAGRTGGRLWHAGSAGGHEASLGVWGGQEVIHGAQGGREIVHGVH